MLTKQLATVWSKIAVSVVGKELASANMFGKKGLKFNIA
jgi:hypothetical protein